MIWTIFLSIMGLFALVIAFKFVYGLAMEFAYGPFHRIRIIKTPAGNFRIEKQGWFSREWYSKLYRDHRTNNIYTFDTSSTSNGVGNILEYSKFEDAKDRVVAYADFLSKNSLYKKNDKSSVVFSGMDEIKSDNRKIGVNSDGLVKQLIEASKSGDYDKEKKILIELGELEIPE